MIIEYCKRIPFVVKLICLMLFQILSTTLSYWIHKSYYGNNLSFNLSGLVPLIFSLILSVILVKVHNKKILINFLISFFVLVVFQLFATLFAVALIGG